MKLPSKLSVSLITSKYRKTNGKLAPRALVSLLGSKCDWEIPQENHLDLLHSSGWSTMAKNNQQIEISGAEKYPKTKKEVRNYMKSTFYKTAPIPKALGLSRNSCKDTDAVINKEINDAVDSGASVLLTKKSGNEESPEIVGCCLNQIWSKNPEYDIVGANAKVWHDAAAEIAMRDSNKSIQHLIWRKLQLLHIYDVGQVMLNQMPQKKFALYLGAGFVNEDVRESDIMEEVFSILLDDWRTKDCIIYMITTFSKMEPIILKRLHNSTVVDQVRYEEEALELNGIRCFQACEGLGGMTFFANFNEKDATLDYSAFPNG